MEFATVALEDYEAQYFLGWGAHYLMGFVFAAVYVELWERGEIRHSLRNGLFLGLASGIIATVSQGGAWYGIAAGAVVKIGISQLGADLPK